MTINTFKPGDEVVCVDNRGLYDINIGDKVIVEKIEVRDPARSILPEDGRSIFRATNGRIYFANKFKLVSSSEIDMFTNPFKPGDKVRCIDAYEERFLELNEIYTVEQVGVTFYGQDVIHIAPHHIFHPYRFELVSPGIDMSKDARWYKTTTIHSRSKQYKIVGRMDDKNLILYVPSDSTYNETRDPRPGIHVSVFPAEHWLNHFTKASTIPDNLPVKGDLFFNRSSLHVLVTLSIEDDTGKVTFMSNLNTQEVYDFSDPSVCKTFFCKYTKLVSEK